MLIIASVVLVLGLLISAISCNRNNGQSNTTNEKILSEQSLINTDADSNKDKIDNENTKKVDDENSAGKENSAKKESAPAQISKEKQLELEEKKKTESTGFDSKHPTNTTMQSSSTQTTSAPSIKSQINNNRESKTIIVGKGGGITGAVTEYQLLNDGRLMKKNGFTAELTEIKKLSGEDLAVVTQKFNLLNLAQVKYNQPGNFYYYLGMQEGLSMHRVTWTGKDEKLPENVQEFYQYMMETVIQ